MRDPFDIYENRFIRDGLAKPGDILMGLADRECRWNQDDTDIRRLESLFDRLDIKAVIYLRPAEPYRSIIDYLAAASAGAIYPRDCETRMLLKDLPVAEALTPEHLTGVLENRKSVIIRGGGIVATGRQDLKEAFVTTSSVCFACFVKFFSDLLKAQKTGAMTPADRRIFESVSHWIKPPAAAAGELMRGPFTAEELVLQAIYEAGKQVVDLRLVDSCFGNISYHAGSMLYISQSGTFLDELAGGIACCPTDDITEAPGNASSELPAHLEIFRKTGFRAILHGHPRFSVILSMDCDVPDCPYNGKCHQYCPYERYACDGIPIVSGEVGGGEYGLCHTVPEAVCGTPGVIVHGHGVFTCDETDFNGALLKLIDIERQCCIEYFRQMGLNR